MDWLDIQGIKNAKRYERCPECKMCGRKITDEICYYIEGEYFCEDCISKCEIQNPADE